MSFERFLDGVGNQYHAVGCHNIGQCDYDYFEDLWKEAGLKILSVDFTEVQKLMPKSNQSGAVKCPQEAIDLVEKAFVKWEGGHPEYEQPKTTKKTVGDIADFYKLPKIDKKTAEMTLEEMVNALKK